MPFSTKEASPLIADIICGSTFSDGGTLITVPAGRVWSGNVALTSQADGGADISGASTITIEDAGAVPATGSLIIHLYVKSTTGSPPMCLALSKNVVIAATSGAVRLQLNIGGASAATGLATGQLL